MTYVDPSGGIINDFASAQLKEQQTSDARAQAARTAMSSNALVAQYGPAAADAQNYNYMADANLRAAQAQQSQANAGLIGAQTQTQQIGNQDARSGQQSQILTAALSTAKEALAQTNDPEKAYQITEAMLKRTFPGNPDADISDMHDDFIKNPQDVFNRIGAAQAGKMGGAMTGKDLAGMYETGINIAKGQTAVNEGNQKAAAEFYKANGVTSPADMNAKVAGMAGSINKAEEIEDQINDLKAMLPGGSGVLKDGTKVGNISGHAWLGKLGSYAPGSPEQTYEKKYETLQGNLQNLNMQNLRENGASFGRTTNTEFQTLGHSVTNAPVGSDPKLMGNMLDEADRFVQRLHHGGSFKDSTTGQTESYDGLDGDFKNLVNTKKKVDDFAAKQPTPQPVSAAPPNPAVLYNPARRFDVPQTGQAGAPAAPQPAQAAQPQMPVAQPGGQPPPASMPAQPTFQGAPAPRPGPVRPATVQQGNALMQMYLQRRLKMEALQRAQQPGGGQ